MGSGRSQVTPQLILTVTRACNLRCSYCPTVKDGWPSLSPDDVRGAIALFADTFGGGDIKLFGGEPLMAPEAVATALDEAERRPEVRRIYLSTNGLGLDLDWIERLRRHSKAVLTLSMDGEAGDHRRLRRALPGVGDAYDHILSLREELLATPRVVITQTIAPSTARNAEANFQHLRSLGFWRFNFLPGYFLLWRPEQLQALRQGFAGIRARIEASWRAGERLYVRNLFTRAPTPFFNTGLIVDADRTVHPSNVGLSGSLDHLRARTQVGSLDAPPTPAELAARSQTVPSLLEEAVGPRVWSSTQDADAELTAFCRGLYPSYFAMRKQRVAS